MAMVAAGATSSGGLTALLVGKFLKEKKTNKSKNETGRKRIRNRTNEKSENRI
jgi:membrane protein YqaA with SNARE-associated domain